LNRIFEELMYFILFQIILLAYINNSIFKLSKDFNTSENVIFFVHITVHLMWCYKNYWFREWLYIFEWWIQLYEFIGNSRPRWPCSSDDLLWKFECCQQKVLHRRVQTYLWYLVGHHWCCFSSLWKYITCLEH